jgi:hypothetical protein
VRERDVEGGSSFAGLTEGTFVERLRATIRDVRARLEAGSSSPDAAAQVRELGSLHRLDRADSTGEAAATDALLAQLRAALVDAQLPAAERRAAEAAVEVGALLALSRREYAVVASLLEQYGARVEGEESTRQLTLVRAHLLARDGHRSEASTLVASLAANSTPIEARELANLAEMLGRRPSALGGLGSHALSGSPYTEVGNAAGALRVLPNPASARARVELHLDSPAHARIVVRDILGRQVAVLVDDDLPTGRASFDLDTGRLPAGTYLIQALLDPSPGGRSMLARRLAVVRR